MRFAPAAFTKSPKSRLRFTACLAGLLLTACGGGSDDPINAQAHSIGGTLTGLAANTTLVLNNGANTLSLATNGVFTFSEPSVSYRVEITTQPSGQVCTITNGSGNAAAPVTDVQVICVAAHGGAGTGPVITSGIVGILGEWQQAMCVATGYGQWARNYLRSEKVNETTISHIRGLKMFTDAQCFGAGSTLGGTAIGQVTFSRSESNASVAANWGTLRDITGLMSQTIWAKRGENTLCLLGDERPSVLPTLDRVAAVLDSVPASGCYTRL